MPQLRITKKAAKALGQKKLGGANNELKHPLDDWYMDYTIIGSQSFFLLMHMASRVACVFKFQKGADEERWLEALPSAISYYFDSLEEHDIAVKWGEYLGEGDVTFDLVKPDSRSVVAHMTQFKQLVQIESVRHQYLSESALLDAMRCWSTYLISIPTIPCDYSRPMDTLKIQLNDYYGSLYSNVIHYDFKNGHVKH